MRVEHLLVYCRREGAKIKVVETNVKSDRRRQSDFAGTLVERLSMARIVHCFVIAIIAWCAYWLGRARRK
jgi:hypothetical protein